ncbi:MAG: VWA domain-containing protein [Victivallales bacterium]|nr:VWA domain-containing protein [Victivallales bacterium]
MFRFETPFALLLALLPVLHLLWQRWHRARRAAVGFSSTANVRRAGKSWRQRLLWLPGTLRWLAIALLAVALARPQSGREDIREVTQGIAIEMVLDRSGSMGLCLDFEGRMQDRLETAKTIFSRFVFGDGKTLQGRTGDLVGMVAFARYSDTVCPLTLSHSVLKPFLKTVALAEEDEDGTAIGDAVALAAARLHTVEETLAKQNRKEPASYQIKSKVMILLTDGQNNWGRRTVAQARELAKQWGVRIYVIAFAGGDVYQSVRTPWGIQHRRVYEREMDTTEIRRLAEETGGLYRAAKDARSLQAVYEEIDSLERSEVESTHFVDYSELYAPFALAAFLVLALEQLLVCTILRRLP